MPAPWIERLRPASFRGAEFHIEIGGRAGGRRTVLHEYPKRDEPYAEDMGRRGRRFGITAYVIGPDYTDFRDALIAAMETEGSGLLVHPTMGEFLVNPENFNCQERRTNGGMAEFELSFVEAGSNSSFGRPEVSTQANVAGAAETAGKSSASSVDTILQNGGTVAI
jgi:prophage DNA circulation protein